MFSKEKIMMKFKISENVFKQILKKHWKEIIQKDNLYELKSFENILSKYTDSKFFHYTMKFNVCTWVLRERFIKFLKLYNESYNHFMKRKILNDHFTYKDIELYTWFNSEISKQINTEVIWNFIKLKKWHSEKLWSTFSKSKSCENYEKYLKREKLEYEVKWFSKTFSTICLDKWKLFILWFELDLENGFMIWNKELLNATLKDNQEFLLKYNKKNDDLYLVIKVETKNFNTKKLFS